MRRANPRWSGIVSALYGAAEVILPAESAGELSLAVHTPAGDEAGSGDTSVATAPAKVELVRILPVVPEGAAGGGDSAAGLQNILSGIIRDTRRARPQRKSELEMLASTSDTYDAWQKPKNSSRRDSSRK